METMCISVFAMTLYHFEYDQGRIDLRVDLSQGAGLCG